MNYFYNFLDKSCFIPIFVDLRANFINGKYIPFFDFKCGYSVLAKDGDSGGGGMYMTPSVGCTFMTSEKFGITLSVGYVFQWSSVAYLDYTDTDYTFYQENNKNLGGVSFKVGVIF